MSKKVFAIAVAFTAIIFIAIYIIFFKGFQQQPPKQEYRQLSTSEFLFTGPPTILSINWSIADKLTIQGIDFVQNSQPIYIGIISTRKVSPFFINGEQIFGYSPTISPNGQYLAFSWNGINIVHMNDINVKEIRLAYTTLDLAWSHDSNYLAFTVIEQSKLEIYIYELQTGQVQLKFSVQQDNLSRSLCCTLAWSADDQKLALALRHDKKGSESTESDIYMLILKNNQFLRVTDTPNVNEEFPVWSPKEDILLFTSTGRGTAENSAKLILARGDGLCQMPITNIQGISSPAWSPDGTKIAFVTEGGVYNFDILSLKNQLNLFRETCNIKK